MALSKTVETVFAPVLFLFPRMKPWATHSFHGLPEALKIRIVDRMIAPGFQPEDEEHPTAGLTDLDALVG